VTELQDLTLAEQASAVAAGTATATDLVDHARRRIDDLDGGLNAVVRCADDEAVAQELHSIRPGPLRGVPVGVKDMFSLPWYAPTDGTGVAYGQPGVGVSGVAARLRDAGSLGVVVTSMHELGIGSTGHISAHGPGANPWDPTRCAGGSSGGSAAAVAARMVAGAVGTDAAGSIRIPAAYCGITGLKPTFGSVSTDGYTGAFSTMVGIGPMTRGADDCRLLGEALLRRRLTSDDRDVLKIGRPRGPLWDDVQPDVATACDAALNTLVGAGAQVSDIAIDDLEHVAFASMVVTGTDRLPQLTADWVARVFPALHPTVRGILKSRVALSANTVQRVTRYRMLLRRRVAAVLRTVDVFAWPTVPATAPDLRRPRAELPSGRTSADLAALRHTGLANLTGIPAITVPCGVDRDGLPIGICFHAAWGREDVLLAVAGRYEQLTARAHVDGCPRRVKGANGAS
jgi:Asp-tRNA(Asn)/Glu-tRNA(Gln) amidotransferase A subunit family amidase